MSLLHRKITTTVVKGRLSGVFSWGILHGVLQGCLIGCALGCTLGGILQRCPPGCHLYVSDKEVLPSSLQRVNSGVSFWLYHPGFLHGKTSRVLPGVASWRTPSPFHLFATRKLYITTACKSVVRVLVSFNKENYKHRELFSFAKRWNRKN
jgi:hypothetical protein